MNPKEKKYEQKILIKDVVVKILKLTSSGSYPQSCSNSD